MTVDGYTFFSLETGELVRSVDRGDGCLPTCFPGEGVVEGVHDLSGCYVDLGTGAVASRPQRPGSTYVWDWQSRAWHDRRSEKQQLVDAWAAVRTKRDKLLAASDWVALRATDRGEPVPETWRQYRQALRDVTQQANPHAIAWPSPPSG